MAKNVTNHTPAETSHGDPAHPNHPDLLDTAAAGAEAEGGNGEPMNVAHVDEEGQGPGPMRLRRAFTMKMFLPDADWINKNVVAKGKGTQVIVGRVFGTCTGFEERTNSVTKGGTTESVKSIALTGTFETQSALTGEAGAVSMLFLPMAFAEQAKATLLMEREDGGASSLVMDIDIGLEATGKTIPYEWTVWMHYEGRAQRAMRNLRNARRPGQSPVQATLPGVKSAALT